MVSRYPLMPAGAPAGLSEFCPGPPARRSRVRPRDREGPRQPVAGYGPAPWPGVQAEAQLFPLGSGPRRAIVPEGEGVRAPRGAGAPRGSPRWRSGSGPRLPGRERSAPALAESRHSLFDGLPYPRIALGAACVNIRHSRSAITRHRGPRQSHPRSGTRRSLVGRVHGAFHRLDPVGHHPELERALGRQTVAVEILQAAQDEVKKKPRWYGASPR